MEVVSKSFCSMQRLMQEEPVERIRLLSGGSVYMKRRELYRVYRRYTPAKILTCVET